MTPIIFPPVCSTTGNKSWSMEERLFRRREIGSLTDKVRNFFSITWRTVREQRIKVEAVAVS